VEQQRLDFTTPTEGARGLRVFFVITRSSVEGCAVSGLSEAAPARVRRQRHAIEVRWDVPLATGTVVTLSLEIKGEPLMVAKTIWLNTLDLPVEADFLSAPSPGRLLSPEWSIEEPERYAEAMLLARDAVITSRPEETLQRYSGFFRDLDVHTNLSLLHTAPISGPEMSSRSGRITSLEDLVRRRVQARRDWAATGNAGPAQGLPGPTAVAAVEHISRVLVSVYRQHLSTGGTLDPEVVWSAFEMFSNGELRVANAAPDAWNCEPDGAMIFGFAEFAFLALEHGFHTQEWTAVLPSHVAIQRIYMVSYAPPPGTPLRFGAYSPRNFSAPKVQADEKQRLRDVFGPKSPEDLAVEAGINARDAFSDGF
jgi:hypothetical protein